MRMNSTSAYQEMMINSKLLEVPRGQLSAGTEHQAGPQDRCKV